MWFPVYKITGKKRIRAGRVRLRLSFDLDPEYAATLMPIGICHTFILESLSSGDCSIYFL